MTSDLRLVYRQYTK